MLVGFMEQQPLGKNESAAFVHMSEVKKVPLALKLRSLEPKLVKPEAPLSF